MTDVSPDLNQVIVSAVQARVEAEVTKALAGDEVLGRMVTAAMNQQVEVPSGGYRSEKKPFLKAVLDRTIQEATKTAVQEAVAGEADAIRAAVAAEVRKRSKEIAASFTDELIENVKKGWSISVAIKGPGER